jgi:uncharacterized protein YjiS (DUF1127 family)
MFVMSYLSDDRAAPLPAGSAGGTIRTVFRALNRYLVQPLLALHRARVAYRQLTALDDRQLADIGLHRSEITQALTGSAVAGRAEPIARTVSADHPTRLAA